MTSVSPSSNIIDSNEILGQLEPDPLIVGAHYASNAVKWSLGAIHPDQQFLDLALNELGRRLFIKHDFAFGAVHADDYLVPDQGHPETVIEGVWRHRPKTPLQSMHIRVGLEHGLAVRSVDQQFYADIRLDQPQDRAFVRRAVGLSLTEMRLALNYVDALADTLASYHTLARARWEPEVRRILEKPRVT